MAQLRREYQQFVIRGAEVLVVGPEDQESLAWHWQREQYPFVGLSDSDGIVANLYSQDINPLRIGRLPTLIVIDRQGMIRYRHHGNSMRDIPVSTKILHLLDGLNETADSAC